MTPAIKKLITAIIAFIALSFGAYVALTDNDPTTNPDPQEIIEAGKDVYDAAKEVKEDGKKNDDAISAPGDEPEINE